MFSSRRTPDSATTRPCVLAHIDEELSDEYGKRIILKMSNGGAYHDPWTPRKRLECKKPRFARSLRGLTSRCCRGAPAARRELRPRAIAVLHARYRATFATASRPGHATWRAPAARLGPLLSHTYRSLKFSGGFICKFTRLRARRGFVGDRYASPAVVSAPLIELYSSCLLTRPTWFF